MGVLPVQELFDGESIEEANIETGKLKSNAPRRQELAESCL